MKFYGQLFILINAFRQKYNIQVREMFKGPGFSYVQHFNQNPEVQAKPPSSTQSISNSLTSSLALSDSQFVFTLTEKSKSGKNSSQIEESEPLSGTFSKSGSLSYSEETSAYPASQVFSKNRPRVSQDYSLGPRRSFDMQSNLKPLSTYSEVSPTRVPQKRASKELDEMYNHYFKCQKNDFPIRPKGCCPAMWLDMSDKIDYK